MADLQSLLLTIAATNSTNYAPMRWDNDDLHSVHLESYGHTFGEVTWTAWIETRKDECRHASANGRTPEEAVLYLIRDLAERNADCQKQGASHG